MSERNTKMRLNLAAVALALALAPLVGAAQDDELAQICSGVSLPFESPEFERFDRNHDDRLTPYEAAECGALLAVYARLDLDDDRGLTRAEYESLADTWRRRTSTIGDDAP